MDFNFDQPTDLEAVLEPQCRVVERLETRRLLRIWRQWNAIYPNVLQFSRVQGNLRGHRALEAYREQEASELLVLMVGSLVGWRCECAIPPLKKDVFAVVVVTPPDYAWSYDFSDFLRRDDAEAQRHL